MVASLALHLCSLLPSLFSSRPLASARIYRGFTYCSWNGSRHVDWRKLTIVGFDCNVEKRTLASRFALDSTCSYHERG